MFDAAVGQFGGIRGGSICAGLLGDSGHFASRGAFRIGPIRYIPQWVSA